MSEVIAYGKKHWPIIAGSVVGVLVLYLIFKNLSAGSASAPAAASSPDLSASGAVTNLSAAADLTNAQTNAQVEIAQINGEVSTSQIQAQLDATDATVAAQLAAEKAKTSASEAVSINGQNEDLAKTKVEVNGAVSTQSLITQGQVKDTQIEGSTLESLARTAGQTAVQIQQAKNVVPLAQINETTHVYDTLASKGKLGGDSTGVSQIASAVLYGEGPQAIAANQPTMVANSAPKVVSAVSSGIGSILGGLFG